MRKRESWFRCTRAVKCWDSRRRSCAKVGQAVKIATWWKNHSEVVNDILVAGATLTSCRFPRMAHTAVGAYPYWVAPDCAFHFPENVGLYVTVSLAKSERAVNKACRLSVTTLLVWLKSASKHEDRVYCCDVFYLPVKQILLTSIP